MLWPFNFNMFQTCSSKSMNSVVHDVWTCIWILLTPRGATVTYIIMKHWLSVSCFFWTEERHFNPKKSGCLKLPGSLEGGGWLKTLGALLSMFWLLTLTYVQLVKMKHLNYLHPTHTSHCEHSSGAPEPGYWFDLIAVPAFGNYQWYWASIPLIV